MVCHPYKVVNCYVIIKLQSSCLLINFLVLVNANNTPCRTYSHRFKMNVLHVIHRRK